MSGEILEFTGYLVSIRPRTRRRLVEYELRVVSSGGEPLTAYTVNPPDFMKPGVGVRVRAVLSRQLGTPRWVVEEMRVLGSFGGLEVEEAVIEEVIGGAYPIIIGRAGNRMFSVPADEELLARVPAQLPSPAYCIFLKRGSELRLVEILSVREYRLFEKIAELISEINREAAGVEEIVRGYLVEAGLPQTT